MIAVLNFYQQGDSDHPSNSQRMIAPPTSLKQRSLLHSLLFKSDRILSNSKNDFWWFPFKTRWENCDRIIALKSTTTFWWLRRRRSLRARFRLWFCAWRWGLSKRLAWRRISGTITDTSGCFRLLRFSNRSSRIVNQACCSIIWRSIRFISRKFISV